MFNIPIVTLLHTNPTVYHMPRSDKRLKSLTLSNVCSQKTECACFFAAKFLSNREELERVLYIWNERPIDIFPTVYHLHHSDERFKRNREKTPVVNVGHRTVFKTALKPR